MILFSGQANLPDRTSGKEEEEEERNRKRRSKSVDKRIIANERLAYVDNNEEEMGKSKRKKSEELFPPPPPPLPIPPSIPIPSVVDDFSLRLQPGVSYFFAGVERTFFSSISLFAALFFSELSCAFGDELFCGFRGLVTGSVAVLSAAAASTSTVATLQSPPPTIADLFSSRNGDPNGSAKHTRLDLTTGKMPPFFS